MAELRRRGLPERFESWVQTARATPRLEAGSPLAGMWNDAVSSIPLPSDVAGLGHLAGALAGEGMNPQGNFPGMAAGLARGLPAGILNQIDQHPFAAIAALAGPPHALDIYREAMPLETRAYLHQFYGGGRPLTKIPKRLQEAILKKAEYSGYPGSVTHTELSRANLIEDLKRQGVKTPPDLSENWHYVQPDVTLPSHMRADDPTHLPMANAATNELQGGLGKFFYNSPEDRIWDYYKFHPSVYEHHPTWQALEQAHQSGGTIQALREAFGQIMSELRDPSRIAPWESGSIQGATPIGTTARWLGHKFGTPYPVDVQLPRR